MEDSLCIELTRLRNEIKNYYMYISLNYLSVNHYSENINVFQIYFQSILNSILPENKNYTERLEDVEKRYSCELEEFDVFIALNYIDRELLCKLLNQLPLRINISENGKEYLERVINNCIMQDNCFNQKITYECNNILYKCMVILGHCSLAEALFDITICALSKMDISCFNADIVNEVINNLYHQNYFTKDNVNCIIQIVDKILTHITQVNEGCFFQSLVRNLLFILKKNNNLYDNVEIIKSVMAKVSKEIWITFYQFLGDNSRAVIDKAYSQWSFIEYKSEFDFYYELLISDIVTIDEETEKALIDYCAQKLADRAKIKGVFTCDESSNLNFIYKLLDLYLRDLINNKEEVGIICNQAKIPEAEWMINYQNYNYDNFDVNWLSKCGIAILNKISNNDLARKEIRAKIEKEYLLGNVSSKIIDIYFKYFNSKT